MGHLELDSLEDWRAWLKKNNLTSNETWIILKKEIQGRSSLTMRDAVDEAIGYDWMRKDTSSDSHLGRMERTGRRATSKVRRTSLTEGE